MIDPSLKEAITNAARYLEKRADWYFGTGGTDSLLTEVDEEFIEAMSRFIFPLMDHEAMLKMRIAKIRAAQKALAEELRNLGESVDSPD